MPRPLTLPPPPTTSELLFQTYQFDERIKRKTANFEVPAHLVNTTLGASFFGTHGKDITLAGQFEDALKLAGNALRDA